MLRAVVVTQLPLREQLAPVRLECEGEARAVLSTFPSASKFIFLDSTKSLAVAAIGSWRRMRVSAQLRN